MFRVSNVSELIYNQESQKRNASRQAQEGGEGQNDDRSDFDLLFPLLLAASAGNCFFELFQTR